MTIKYSNGLSGEIYIVKITDGDDLEIKIDSEKFTGRNS